MAEAVLLAVTKIGSALANESATVIINKLSEKVQALKELPRKMDQIRMKLTLMSDTIQEIGTVYLIDKPAKSWIGEVRKVAYHVEDVIDKYSYHILEIEEAGFLMKYFIKGTHYVKVFSDIADEVAMVEQDIQQIILMRDQWLQHSQLVPDKLAMIERQRSQDGFPDFVKDEDLVGIEKNRKLLSGWLYSDELDSTVITVSGMGGLGKSTLVTNLYEREKVNFPVHAWIVVSQICPADALLRKLLWKIGNMVPPVPSEIDKMDVHDLKAEIKKKLQNRKCLIVLDDVWEQEVYFKIHDAFENHQASRIIITTRKDHVGAIASLDHHLELEPLDGPDAFDLFCRRAFHNKKDHKCPKEFEEIAKSIVDRCHGLPLAIVTIGSLLSSRPRINIWNQTYNQLRSELSTNDHVRAILNLSYHDLSGGLRNCFLYCSLFPEDYPMSRESLVRLWVAEGFVLSKEKNTPEEVAEGNLMELIHRNMLEVVDYDELGRVSTCKMHDIMRDLALSIAKEEKFGSANDYEAIIQGMTNSTQGTMEAPVSSSLGAMGSLFRKLGILLDPKYPLRSSLKHAIKLLVEDLEEIRDAHMEQLMADSHNSKAKYWMEEVRELSYDIEDSIDFMMLSHNAANEKPRSIHAPKLRVARLKIRGLPSMLKLSTRIVRVAELRTLLWEASERHARYQLDGCVSNPRSVFSGRSSRITLVYKVVADPIGIEGPKKELTMWLTNQAEQQLKVLCIFGPAGIGKTTLAKELYRELSGKFDCRAFIRVSQNPDISRLLQELLYQILRPNKQNLYACSVQGDIENIRKHLEEKRYFIVIDDLWEAEAWDIIKNAFPNGSNCSRVIITCEVKNIAPECSGYHTVDTFEMKPLGSQDSENLFLDRALSSDNQCPDPLKDVSCRMLKECGGLPLAIISAAGLFASLRDNSDIWHQLLQSVLSTLENLSLEDMLKEIVSICYNNLPQELKTCLLYLTMYPVGCTIWKDDLLKQWAAEGFITTTKGNEGVAENYFNELVKRGMIQPEKINYNNEVLSCTVHHVVLDLITYKSREENFITAVDYSRTNAMFLMKARRLSLHYSCAQYATEPEGIRVSQVRSLAFFGLPRCMPSVIEFKLLRVLILEFWGNKDDCTSINLSRIRGLCLLRYLKISSQIYVELPSEIQGLKFLEILEIDARVSAVLNEKMLEIDARESAVPNDIVHLPGLLHLGIRDGTKLPDRIGLITSLQTLKCFDLGCNSEDNVQSLGELINLRDLHLTCSKEVPHEHLKRKLVALASSFGRLANLKSLTLAHGAVGMTMFVDHSSAIFSTPMFLQRLELPPICTFSRLPEWIGKLHKLCVLKIVVRVLLRSDIDILTGLPGLTVLSLYVRQPNAECVVFNSGAFPVLKYFKYRCSALCIAFREEALPNLRRLKVCFNFHRDEIYSHMISGVEHLLNLKEIAVRIGAADGGVEESDRRAVESAFESTIHKHPRFPIYMNVRSFDWVE